MGVQCETKQEYNTMSEITDIESPREVQPGNQQDIIHTLRTAQQHQVTLSMIADQKANIIIGFALIFFSVIQSQIFSAEFLNDIYFFPIVSRQSNSDKIA